MSSRAIRYLVFDIESIADGDLISKVRYPDKNYSPEKAIEVLCAERLEQYGTEFIPYTYHLPVSVAIIKVRFDLTIDDIVTLDPPHYRPHIITKHFWEGWRAYQRPAFVSFNGRTFDLPLMELSAFRFGIGVPDWFNFRAKSYEQKRNRYNIDSHVDMQEVLTNFGATRFSGGLNLAANILGRPGKMGIAGHMVQELYDQGELNRINDYCRCDVLDTYFVLLRTRVLTGEISIDQEQQLVADAMQWLNERKTEFPVYGEYLQQCTQWHNPWAEQTDPNAAQQQNIPDSTTTGDATNKPLPELQNDSAGLTNPDQNDDPTLPSGESA